MVVHELVSEVLEQLGSVDQCDICNLVGAETLCLRMQHVEYEIRKRVEAKTPYDSSTYWMGKPRRTGGAIQSPDLAKFIASKASQESAIMKEQRKAEEERTLARAKAPPKKKEGT